MLLVAVGCYWMLDACQQSRATPPWLFGGRFTGWGFIGREGRSGPQAMSGTWYNLPPGGAAADGPIALGPPPPCDDHPGPGIAGAWFWVRSPEQEKVVIAGLYNRYCIRCHGIDGRGIWDIPGVPDFTNTRWQLSRSDDQIARIIIEGRGAVMPTFRGTLNLEEAWAMARYLRSFVPGTEASRPNLGSTPDTSKTPELAPLPKQK
jgi:mono/diheme cytochrome c family protein